MDWDSFYYYLMAAETHPSDSFTLPLCEALRYTDAPVDHERVVDLLAVIKDPRSVNALDEMIWWEPDWDEFRGLAWKAALALALIGTPEAFEVLRGAAATADPRTREFSQGVLEHAERHPDE
jgi:hypothetical protein